MPGIDRVGIAQPVLDRGDRQFQWPRRAWRLRRGLLDRLDLVGAVELGGEADKMFAGPDRGLPARFARDRLQPVQETRGYRRRAADLGGVAEDDFVGAEQLREIVRRKADAPLRQIETERMPHRPAQPWIDPRRRWPDAFDQSAEDDAVGLGQPRFQRAIDAKLSVGDLRPPHHAVAERGLEHLRIIAERHHQAARCVFAEQVVECGCQHRALMAFERQRHVLRIARQIRSAPCDGIRRVRQNHAVWPRGFPAA